MATWHKHDAIASKRGAMRQTSHLADTAAALTVTASVSATDWVLAGHYCYRHCCRQKRHGTHRRLWLMARRTAWDTTVEQVLLWRLQKTHASRRSLIGAPCTFFTVIAFLRLMSTTQLNDSSFNSTCCLNTNSVVICQLSFIFQPCCFFWLAIFRLCKFRSSYVYGRTNSWKN